LGKFASLFNEVLAKHYDCATIFHQCKYEKEYKAARQHDIAKLVDGIIDQWSQMPVFVMTVLSLKYKEITALSRGNQAIQKDLKTIHNQVIRNFQDSFHELYVTQQQPMLLDTARLLVDA